MNNAKNEEEGKIALDKAIEWINKCVSLIDCFEVRLSGFQNQYHLLKSHEEFFQAVRGINAINYKAQYEKAMKHSLKLGRIFIQYQLDQHTQSLNLG